MKKQFKISNSKSKDKQLVTKSQVRQMIKSDTKPLMKYVDTVYNGAGTGTSASLIVMPTTGNGESSMSGTTIEIDSIDLNYCIHDTPDLSTDSYAFRYTVVQAIGEGGVSVADVYQTVSSTNSIITSPFRYDGVNKSFRVLFDKVVWVDSYNTISHTKAKFKPKIRNCRYDALNSVWSTGQLVQLFNVANYLTGTDMGLDYHVRVNFLDV
jgi:hemolysin activation/secretion protein